MDRTGALVFILNGVLGVDDDDLSRGWELSWPASNKFEIYYDPMVNILKEKYGKPGDSIQTKIEAYLYQYGITPEEIAKFREIMLEE